MVIPSQWDHSAESEKQNKPCILGDSAVKMIDKVPTQ